MKRDAIIEIICNDLKEIKLLLENFKGEEPIDTQFINLVKSKHNDILREIDLLSFWANDTRTIPSVPTQQSEPSPVPVAKTLPDSIPATVPDTQPVQEPKHKQTPADIQQTVPETTTQTLDTPQPDPVTVTENIDVHQPDPAPVAPTKPTPAPSPAQPVTPNKTIKASDVTNFGTPVSDIRKAIAIADRFLYQKELFFGSADDFNSALDLINTFDSYEDAERYLVATYGWNPDDNTTQAFLRAVHRRFI